MVLLPVHLIAFALLYIGTMRIVRGEILRTHTHDATVILEEAVQDLHPLMVAHEGGDAQARLESFLTAHEVLDLHLYGPSGVLLGNRTAGGPVDPEVAAFLASGQREQFEFQRDGDTLALHGLTRLDSEEACHECHPADAVLGVASMRLDMTPQVDAAHDRMSRNLGLLIIVWGGIVALTTSVAARYARRSVEQLRAGIRSGIPGTAPQSGVGKLLLDPVSGNLYDSLREVLERQQRRDVEVTSRLHHTQRLASLGQLAAGLAHEIKNPLAGIRGVLELMRDDEPDGERIRLYREMLQELDRVNGTIHSLLGFARPSPPKRVPTDVAELIDGTAKLLRPGLSKNGIRLVTTVDPNTLSFRLDPDQIRQVVVNLVNNAAEAIERDGTIAIRATPFPDGSGLILAVADDGPGISEDAQEEIFEPFYSTKFSGTGLGLAVAKSLVSKHDGELQVESRLGHGSTFFVLLPEPDPENDEASGRTD
jgi:signal transduction histidine kinase